MTRKQRAAPVAAPVSPPLARQEAVAAAGRVAPQAARAGTAEARAARQAPQAPRQPAAPPERIRANTYSLAIATVIASVSGSGGAPIARGSSENSAVTTTRPPPATTAGTNGSASFGATSAVVPAAGNRRPPAASPSRSRSSTWRGRSPLHGEVQPVAGAQHGPRLDRVPRSPPRS